MDAQLDWVTYCGLHCNLCAERTRIPERAAALQRAMAEESWPSWGHAVPGFGKFWEFLGDLQARSGCPGCRFGGGYPDCHIRACARQRDLDLCCHCSDFPCEHVEALAARYPTLIADNRRLRTAGLEHWLREQAERVRRGVVYADIRYPAIEPAEEGEHEYHST